jgi:peptide/nickel transport system permease protein
MLVFKRFMRNKLAITGLIILIVMFAFAFLGGIVSPYSQSQVFKHDEEIMKEYATCMQSTDYRFTIREGAAFPDAARAQAVLAISKGQTSFTYDDKTYSLVQEGENVYTFGDALMVANTRTLAGKFSISAVEATGFTVSDELPRRHRRRLKRAQVSLRRMEPSTPLKTAARPARFITGSIALASKSVFDPYEESMQSLTKSFAFRYAVEIARAKGETTFTLTIKHTACRRGKRADRFASGKRNGYTGLLGFGYSRFAECERYLPHSRV